MLHFLWKHSYEDQEKASEIFHVVSRSHSYKFHLLSCNKWRWKNMEAWRPDGYKASISILLYILSSLGDFSNSAIYMANQLTEHKPLLLPIFWHFPCHPSPLAFLSYIILNQRSRTNHEGKWSFLSFTTLTWMNFLSKSLVGWRSSLDGHGSHLRGIFWTTTCTLCLSWSLLFILSFQ